MKNYYWRILVTDYKKYRPILVYLLQNGWSIERATRSDDGQIDCIVSKEANG